jgi:energy-coupling factor transporter ATP-binding protein EcfA2
MGSDNKDAMRHWRCRLSVFAWLLAGLASLFSAALTVFLAESVLQQLAAVGGVWSAVPFCLASVFVVAGIAFTMQCDLGRGAILGSWFRIPPASLVGVLAALVFWLWLGWIGPKPRSHLHIAHTSYLRPLEVIFARGWVWLWGAVISCGVGSSVWQSLAPKLFARFGMRLRQENRLGPSLQAVNSAENSAAREESSIPEEAKIATKDADNIDEIIYWLQGNDEPLQPGEKSLFALELSPVRIIRSLRPMHLDGNARTLALIGPRGSGKSSLLRLASALPASKQQVELRFVYVSLWEYKTAQAAIQAMIKKVLHEIRHRIDIAPFTDTAGAFVRAIAGDGRFQWLANLIQRGSSIEDILYALSTVLLLNKLRVIICIEDDDRLEGTVQRDEFVSLLTASVDFIRRFPAFGYVLCIASDDWDALQSEALGKISDPKKREQRHSDIFKPEEKRKGGNIADGDGRILVGLNDEEISERHLTAMAAAKDQRKGFDTVRLCREELVIPPLRRAQWEPVLISIRDKMLGSTKSSESGQKFGLDQQYRKDWWSGFIDALEPAPAPRVVFNPEYGLRFTPRTLRQGLADAWRKWSAIRPKLDREVIIDPDSVLVACLVRACRPDVWNILIRNDQLLTGGDWPDLEIVTPSPNGAAAVRPAPIEAFPCLGLNVVIRNMLRKKFEIWKIGPTPSVSANQRPGGLIGKLPSEAGAQLGLNWRLFLDA